MYFAQVILKYLMDLVGIDVVILNLCTQDNNLN